MLNVNQIFLSKHILTHVKTYEKYSKYIKKTVLHPKARNLNITLTKMYLKSSALTVIE